MEVIKVGKHKVNIDNCKTVAVYVRVAHADNFALENQKNTLLNFANKQGFGTLKFYEDNGFNGLNLNRPAFNTLNEDIVTGFVETVIAHDVSRISRNRIDFSKWINNIQSKGVSFKTVLNDYNNSLQEINNMVFKLYKENCQRV